MSQTHNIPAEWSWLLELDEDELIASVPDNVRELIEEFGSEFAIKMVMYYGGQQIYVPKPEGAFRRPREQSGVERLWRADAGGGGRLVLGRAAVSGLSRAE